MKQRKFRKFKKPKYIFILSTIHKEYRKRDGKEVFWGHNSNGVYWNYTFKEVEKELIKNASWYHDGWNIFAVIEKCFKNPDCLEKK